MPFNAAAICIFCNSKTAAALSSFALSAAAFLAASLCFFCKAKRAFWRFNASASNLASNFCCFNILNSVGVGFGFAGGGVVTGRKFGDKPATPPKTFLGKSLSTPIKFGITPNNAPTCSVVKAIAPAISSMALAASLASVPPPIRAKAFTKPPPMISDALPVAMERVSIRYCVVCK